METGGRRRGAWIAAGVFVAALVGVQIVSPRPTLSPDAVDYLSMARSLARDGTLRRLGDEHVRLAPAYPFVIAPLFWLADEPFLLLSVLNGVLLAGFGAAAYVWARRVAPDAAPYAALFAVVNVVVIASFRRPLSETVFCGLLFAAAAGYNAALARPVQPGWWVLLVPAQCVLALTRQAGALVGVGFAGAVLWQASRGRRSWRSAVGLAALGALPPVLAVVAWAAYDGSKAHRPGEFNHAAALNAGPGPEAADLPTTPLGRRLAEGLRVRIAEIGRVTVPLMAKVYAPAETWWHTGTLLYIPVFALVVVGWVCHMRSADDALAWTWPLYFALYVYWPFDQAARFTAPLVPLLVVCLWRACGDLGGRRVVFATLVVAHLVVSLGTWVVTERPRHVGLWSHEAGLRLIADDFRDRPGELGGAADSTELLYPLVFWLDRPLPIIGEGTVRVRWVVAWDDARKSVPLEKRAVVVRRNE
jgi:hypothetical protein